MEGKDSNYTNFIKSKSKPNECFNGSIDERLEKLERALVQSQISIKSKDSILKLQSEQLDKLEQLYRKSLQDNENLMYDNKRNKQEVENLKTLLEGFEQARFKNASSTKGGNQSFVRASKTSRTSYINDHLQNDNLDLIPAKINRKPSPTNSALKNDCFNKNEAKSCEDEDDACFTCYKMKDVISTLQLEVSDLRNQIHDFKTSPGVEVGMGMTMHDDDFKLTVKPEMKNRKFKSNIPRFCTPSTCASLISKKPVEAFDPSLHNQNQRKPKSGQNYSKNVCKNYVQNEVFLSEEFSSESEGLSKTWNDQEGSSKSQKTTSLGIMTENQTADTKTFNIIELVGCSKSSYLLMKLPDSDTTREVIKQPALKQIPSSNEDTDKRDDSLQSLVIRGDRVRIDRDSESNGEEILILCEETQDGKGHKGTSNFEEIEVLRKKIKVLVEENEDFRVEIQRLNENKIKANEEIEGLGRVNVGLIEEIEDIKKENKNLNKEIESLKKRGRKTDTFIIEEKSEEIEDLMSENQNLYEEVKSLKKTIKNLKADIANLNREIEDLYGEKKLLNEEELQASMKINKDLIKKFENNIDKLIQEKEELDKINKNLMEKIADLRAKHVSWDEIIDRSIILSLTKRYEDSMHEKKYLKEDIAAINGQIEGLYGEKGVLNEEDVQGARKINDLLRNFQTTVDELTAKREELLEINETLKEEIVGLKAKHTINITTVDESIRSRKTITTFSGNDDDSMQSNRLKEMLWNLALPESASMKEENLDTTISLDRSIILSFIKKKEDALEIIAALTEENKRLKAELEEVTASKNHLTQDSIQEMLKEVIDSSITLISTKKNEELMKENENLVRELKEALEEIEVLTEENRRLKEVPRSTSEKEAQASEHFFNSQTETLSTIYSSLSSQLATLKNDFEFAKGIVTPKESWESPQLEEENKNLQEENEKLHEKITVLAEESQRFNEINTLLTEENKKLLEKLKTLTSWKDMLNEEINALKKENEALIKASEASGRERSGLREEIGRLEESYRFLTDEIQNLKIKNASLIIKNEDLREEIQKLHELPVTLQENHDSFSKSILIEDYESLQKTKESLQSTSESLKNNVERIKTEKSEDLDVLRKMYEDLLQEYNTLKGKGDQTFEEQDFRAFKRACLKHIVDIYTIINTRPDLNLQEPAEPDLIIKSLQDLTSRIGSLVDESRMLEKHLIDELSSSKTQNDELIRKLDYNKDSIIKVTLDSLALENERLKKRSFDDVSLINQLDLARMNLERELSLKGCCNCRKNKEENSRLKQDLQVYCRLKVKYDELVKKFELQMKILKENEEILQEKRRLAKECEMLKSKMSYLTTPNLDTSAQVVIEELKARVSELEGNLRCFEKERQVLEQECEVYKQKIEAMSKHINQHIIKRKRSPCNCQHKALQAGPARSKTPEALDIDNQVKLLSDLLGSVEKFIPHDKGVCQKVRCAESTVKDLMKKLQAQCQNKTICLGDTRKVCFAPCNTHVSCSNVRCCKSGKKEIAENDSSNISFF